MVAYVVAIEGLSQYIDDIDTLPEKERMAAIQAINKTADRARTAAQRRMIEQVNFKASYLNERLRVTRRAAGRRLEAAIGGRDRPTSMARFVKKETGGGVSVAVKPGVAKFIRRSFIMRLRGAGGELTNRGLAVRTNGGPPKGAYKPKKISENLYLIYGPSVDQVFRDTKNRFRPEMDAEAADFLEKEFLRLMDLQGDL